MEFSKTFTGKTGIKTKYYDSGVNKPALVLFTEGCLIR